MHAPRPNSCSELRATSQAAISRAGLEFFSHRDQAVAVRVTSGADDDGTLVETITPDCAFIVDSLLAYFHAIGAPVREMLHPVFRVARDSSGNIQSFETGGLREGPESYVQAELVIHTTSQRAEEMANEVRAC